MMWSLSIPYNVLIIDNLGTEYLNTYLVYTFFIDIREDVIYK